MNLKLLITFLMLPFCGKAQISNIYSDTSYHSSFRLVTRPQVNDTVKCIMLIADTCNCYHGQKTTDMKEALQWEGFSYYIHGYAYYTDLIHIKYLDENKKPLSKNIIVWMSKNTEP